MITIIEQNSYIEGVFQTREEAHKYMKTCRKKNLKLVELGFDTFPVYFMQRGSVNTYTSSQEEIIAYADSFDLKYLWGANDIAFNLNYITEPFNRRDEPMYFMSHDHMDKCALERLRKKPEEWALYFGRMDNVKRLLREQLKQKTWGSRMVTEIKNALHLCSVFGNVEVEKISGVHYIGLNIEKKNPAILLYEKDKRGKRPLSLGFARNDKGKVVHVKPTVRDILVKMDRKPSRESEPDKDGSERA